VLIKEIKNDKFFWVVEIKWDGIGSYI
jgi:hypothetical protein